MALAGTTYKGNQSGKSVDVVSGEVLLCTANRADRGVCATGAIRLGRSATKPQAAKPCRHVLILIPES